MFYLYYLAAILVILSLWYLQAYLKWRKDILQYMEKIPGPKRYPFVGTLYKFIGIKRTDLFKYFMSIIDEYKPFFRTWAGPIPEIHVMKPNHLEIIMSSSTHNTKGDTYSFLNPWLGDGLLLSSGSKWHQRRKMITPTFHFKILENFMEVFVEKSKLLVDVLEERVNDEGFDVYPFITHCALDIICETAMGVEINSMSQSDNSYPKAIYDASEQIIRRSLTPWLLSDLYYLFPEGRAFQKNLNILHGFTSKVISDRKKILKEGTSKKTETASKKRLSFLDLLLESSTSDVVLSDTDIREEVDTFMFEGHDTTTAAICWSLFLLANNQDIQDKVYEEVKSVLGDKKTPETIHDLSELNYLERCVKEALRMYPSVPFISRTLTEDVTIDGKKVPKGVQCNIHIYRVHKDPEHHPEPEKFDPDRFLPENSIGRHPYAYIPFSAGPRNCIGQKFAMYEEKTLLASILRSYKIIAVDTLDTINMISELILRPENGIKIKLQKRKM